MTPLNQISVVVIGGINMNLITVSSRFPEAGETVVGSRFLTYPGGNGANQTVAVARMGVNTLMVGRMGDAILGPHLTEAMAASGIDVSGVAVEPGVSSGLAVINIDASSHNRIIQILGTNQSCEEAKGARAMQGLQGASVQLLQLEVSADLSLAVARKTAAQGKTVILDPGQVRTLPVDFYSCYQMITPNKTEAQALVRFPMTDIPSAARAAQSLVERGVRVAIIKPGAQGAYFATKKGGRHIPSFAVEAVDSVAADDAFNGALVASLAEGEELSSAMHVASAAGALAVTKFGAQDSMPPKNEVGK